MISVSITEPTVEPVSLLQCKQQLHLDSTPFSGGVTVTNLSALATRSAATYTSGSKDIAGAEPIIQVVIGDATGGMTIQAQDSDDDSTFDDFGDSVSITSLNDNQTQQIFYTGLRQYVRAQIVVASGASATYGVDVLEIEPITDEDTRLTSLIEASRMMIEASTNQSMITQTWDFYFQSWPGAFYLWRGPLQSVTGIYYTDGDDVENTVSASTYVVDTKYPGGRILLRDDSSWPSSTLTETNPIRVRAVVGYGSAATSVPQRLRQAVIFQVEDLFDGSNKNKEVVKNLISKYKTLA